MNKPEYIIIHTAAFRGHADIDEVRRWHLERGFSDVGYHYYIRRSGELQKGREENVAGAHCRNRGMNRKSIGVCFEGDGDHEYWTIHQWNAFYLLVGSLATRHAIAVEDILGHRETGSPKTCPGNLVDMDQVRSWFV